MTSKKEKVEEEVRRTNGAVTQELSQFSTPNIFLHVESPSGKFVKIEATSQDCVLDIRQFLLDCPETCDITCYHLEFEGNEISDYCELSELTELLATPGPHQFKIVPGYYDERTARLHVRRLREVLINPPTSEYSSSLYLDKNDKKDGLDKYITSETMPEFTLVDFHGNKKSKQTIDDSFISNLNFSAWNPPPGNRRLRGDLLYLECSTVEGVTHHITSSPEGFHLNSSTNETFDPSPNASGYKSHTLADLLKKLSPSFGKKMAKLMNRKTTTHPFENMEVPRTITCWNSLEKPHTYDWNRSEDALLSTFGMDARGVLRDWNEEFQSCRELPKITLHDTILRDKIIYRVSMDFVDAATKGACAIVNGDVPPINPMDPKRSYVYIFNNIFFSFAVDARNVYEKLGGDAVSHSIANHDLRGIESFVELDIPDLYTLATVIVDYRGSRMICQSIIPGIFHGDKSSRHVYGSMDQGAVIERKEDFHQLLQPVAEKLHYKEHPVADSKGNVTSLYTCVESKGIVGSDGRHYILDLIRPTPRDANFPDPTLHSTKLLRPELIQFYCRKQAFDKCLSLERKKSEARKLKEVKEDAEKTEAETKEAGKDDQEPEETESPNYIQFLAEITFNTDCFTIGCTASTPEEIAKDEEEVKSVSSFLTTVVIPNVVQNFASLELSPTDGASLTQIFHDNGVNMRYLGKVAELCETNKINHIKNLCEAEMIVRAAKHMINQAVKSVKPDKSQTHWYAAPCVVAFLNSFLGPNSGGQGLSVEQLAAADIVLNKSAEKNQDKLEREREVEKKQHALQLEKEKMRSGMTGAEAEQLAAASVAATAAANEATSALAQKDKELGLTPGVDTTKKKKKKKNKKAVQHTPNVITDPIVVRLPGGHRAPIDPLSPPNLWQSIRASVKDKFSYELPTTMSWNARSKLGMLRSLCQKCGIQVRNRQLKFDSKDVFVIEDILDLFPVVKFHSPPSKHAKELLNDGQASLAQGKIELAFTYLQDALAYSTQTYGPMHSDVAACYRNIAMVCYHAGDYMQAVEHQQRALIICERVLGGDHNETAHAHSNLALFLHSIGQPELALKHIIRAVFLFELMSGPDHPDTAASHINLAMIHQDSGRIPIALKHLHHALARNIETLGESHAQVALSHHSIAVAYGLLGLFRHALTHEQKSKQIFTAILGSNHTRVKTSLYWINQFTSGAVSQKQKGTAIEVSDKISRLSPLTWVSLRSSTPFRGRLTMNDVLQLFGQQPQQQQQPQQKQIQTTEQQQQITTTATTETTPTANTNTNKNKKKRNKKKGAAAAAPAANATA